MAVDTIEKTVIRIEADVKNALSEINRLKTGIGGIDGEAAKAASGTSKSSLLMKNAWAAVATAVVAATASAGIAIGAFAASSVKAATEVEQYMVSLGVLYKSQELAADQMKWIFDFAKETPFEVSGLVDASIKLKSFGLEARDVLEVLGDTASATSKPIDQVVQAYGRISVGDAGQGIAMFRDIGINLKNISELQFDAQGSLVTPIAEAMPLIQEYLNEEFGGMMEAQSKTAKGIWSNIKDSIYQAGLAVMGFESATATFSEGGIFAGIKDALQGVLDYINTIDFRAIGKAVGDVFSKVVGYVRDLRTGMAGIDPGPIFDFMKEGLKGILDFLDKIDFVELGKSIKSAFELGIDVAADFVRGIRGVDLSGMIEALKLAGATLIWLWKTEEKYNVFEAIGWGIKTAINTISDFMGAVTKGVIGGINLMIDAYNALVPSMQRVGIEADYIGNINTDKTYSKYTKSTEEKKKSSSTEVWSSADVFNASQKNGMSASNLMTSVSNSSNVEVNKTGFNTLASKLDSVVDAVKSIKISTGTTSTTSTALKTAVKVASISNPLFNTAASRWI